MHTLKLFKQCKLGPETLPNWNCHQKSLDLCRVFVSENKTNLSVLSWYKTKWWHSKTKLSLRRVFMIMNFVCGDASCKEMQKIIEASQCSCRPLETKEISDCCSQEVNFLISINYLKKKKSDYRLEPNEILSAFMFSASEIPLKWNQKII